MAVEMLGASRGKRECAVRRGGLTAKAMFSSWHVSRDWSRQIFHARQIGRVP
jgi:hypothetical protein